MRYFLLLIALMSGYIASAQLSPEETKRQQEQERHEERVKAREARTAAFKQHMDSVILSHSYAFIPNSFQQQPAGSPHMIANPNFRLDVYPNFTDIYLPYIKGITPPYILTVINYTVTSVDGYTAVQNDQGWTITFKSSLYSANTYTFTLTIYTTTGEAILDLSSDLYNTVTYNGTIMGHY